MIVFVGDILSINFTLTMNLYIGDLKTMYLIICSFHDIMRCYLLSVDLSSANVFGGFVKLTIKCIKLSL